MSGSNQHNKETADDHRWTVVQDMQRAAASNGAARRAHWLQAIVPVAMQKHKAAPLDNEPADIADQVGAHA